MDKRFHTRAMSAAAAVLTLTSAVTSVSAAQKNEITLTSAASILRSGDSFNVKVGYKPDSKGISGFTIDLHYDPNAVKLNIPYDNGYNISSDFALVTNFEYSNDTVRIVGADLNANNVKTETMLGYLNFTVKDGFEGDVKFWTEVETMVSSSNGSFVNADYTSTSSTEPFTIHVLPEEPDPVVTTTSSSEPEPETTTTAETTTEVTTTAPLPEEIIPEPTTTTTVTTTAPVETTTNAPEQDEETTTTTLHNNDGSEPLFTHSQGSSDYVNDEALQFIFSPYEFSTDDILDQTVDINIDVTSTGTVVGGIGMQTDEGWKVYNGQRTLGDAVWRADDVDLSKVQGNIAVQVYYLKNNSDFAIKSIKVSPSGNGYTSDDSNDDSSSQTDDNTYSEADSSSYDDTTSSSEQDSYTDTSSAEDSSSETASSEEQNETVSSEADSSSQAEENNSSSTDTSSVSESTSSSDSSSTPDSSSQSSSSSASSSSQASSTADNSSSSQNQNTSSQSSSTGGQNNNSGNNNSNSSQVENAVENAKKIADNNPNTGKKISLGFIFAGTLIAASIGQICYSFYTLTRMNKKNK